MPDWLTRAFRHVADAIYARTTAGVVQRQRLGDEARATTAAAKDLLTRAMTEYDAAWRGHTIHGDMKARSAAAAAIAKVREVDDQEAQGLMDAWADRFAQSHMDYRSGAEPAGHAELMEAYRAVDQRLGDLLAAARRT